MKEEHQKEFLIEEYKELHQSYYNSIVSVTSIFRFFIILFAGALSGIILAIAKDIPPDRLKFISVCLCTFLFILSIISFHYILNGFYGMVRKLRAINMIRRYFLDIVPENAKYFKMPTSDRIPSGDERQL
ncbi:MAG: hypothetical protein P9X24_03480 [Candidatus Hatepunaea meridiana]|nr:hypothetical protein [Candidatus Hatepunaea meridiana]